MKLIVITVVLFGALSVMVVLGILVGNIPEYSRISNFLASGYTGEDGQGNVKIAGKISSIESLMPLRFTIHDFEKPAVTVHVETEEAPPENFKVGTDVGLKGNRYDPETRTFRAYHISTACPSKYEASEQANKEYNAGGRSPLDEVLPPAQSPPAAPE